MKRIGIFGGSFNPVHLGHLQIAEAAQAQFQLDQVRFIPTAIPPHKQNQTLASDQHRLAMLRLALEGKSNFFLDECEIRRGGVSYTYETVLDLKKRFPDSFLFLIFGSDQLEIFPQWKQVHLLLQVVQPIIYPRAEFPFSRAGELNAFFSAEEQHKFHSGFLKLSLLPISATEIRQKVQLGISIDSEVPDSVADYIRVHGLYH